MNLRDGKGKLTMANGEEYDGEWKVDMATGNGIC